MTTISRPDTQTSVTSVDGIRAAFPAMQRRHGGHAVAYLDGPGGTQVPSPVVDAMADYLYHHNANTHWKYPTSAETDELIADARRTLADFVNGSPDEIAFGNNMTTITFHIARAWGRGWDETYEVVVTALDHHANVAPWRALERERGMRIRTARMRAEDGTLDLDELERLITDRTRLVAIGAASNALGTIVDVPRVAALARAKGALVYCDAVHFAPHVLPDVHALDCDFLACSAYKFYGPHIGVLWGKRDILERLDVPKLMPAPEEAPERLETGTQNHEGIIGAAAAVDFLAGLSASGGSRRARLAAAYDALHARGSQLFARLWSGLDSLPRVKKYGLPPHGHRTSTLAFTVKNVSSEAVAVALAERGLFVSHGDFYAASVIEALGLGPDGVVRVGCSAYTTTDEIDRVVDAVSRLAS